MKRLFLPVVLAASGLGAAAVWWLAPDLWPLLFVLLTALVLLLVLGALNPGWQWFGAVALRGNGQRKQVALTFDDGPHPVHTRRILDLLDEVGARGTFFMVGARVGESPDVAREVVERGHQVGHHGDRHNWRVMLSPRRSALDLHAGSLAIASATGLWPRFFRPPIGLVSPELLAAAQEAGLVPIAWSLRSFDGRSVAPERVRDRILSSVEPGDIVLMHDAGPDRHRDEAPPAVAALPDVLAGLAERGLEPVTVAELLDEPAYREEPSSHPAAARTPSRPALARAVAATLAVIVLAATASALAVEPERPPAPVLSDGFPASFVAVAATLAGHRTVQSRFRQSKSSDLFVDEVVRTGLLQLRSEGRRLLWTYDEGARLLLADGRLFSLSGMTPGRTRARRLPPAASRMAELMEALFFLRLGRLEKHFVAADLGEGWFRLRPRSPARAVPFKSVRLRVGGQPLALQEVVMEEAGGDTTTIVFTDVELNEPLAEELFRKPGEKVAP